jgi:hypothetical protein
MMLHINYNVEINTTLFPLLGFHVIAGCFMDDSEAKLKDHTNSPDKIHCVKLDGIFFQPHSLPYPPPLQPTIKNGIKSNI